MKLDELNGEKKVKIHQLIPHDTKIDFVSKRFLTFALSIVLTILSLVALNYKGLNYGIDFRGGFILEIKSPEKIDLSNLRTKLSDLHIGDVTLQEFGKQGEVLVRIPSNAIDQETQNKELENVKKVIGEKVEYRKIEKIGPKVGKELIDAATLAVVLSLAGILLYIWIRFEWQFAICGVIALAHDCLMLLGFYSLFHSFEFSTNAIVALLMTACYSIHDTVVVYDRIRENMEKLRTLNLVELLNLSMNETLSRTLLTSLTTLISLAVLCLFGGKVIYEFSFPILFGIAFGTFSSICLAAPMLLYTGLKLDGKEVKTGLKLDEKDGKEAKKKVEKKELK